MQAVSSFCVAASSIFTAPFACNAASSEFSVAFKRRRRIVSSASSPSKVVSADGAAPLTAAAAASAMSINMSRERVSPPQSMRWMCEVNGEWGVGGLRGGGFS